jgi:hypothetical protein
MDLPVNANFIGGAEIPAHFPLMEACLRISKLNFGISKLKAQNSKPYLQMSKVAGAG